METAHVHEDTAHLSISRHAIHDDIDPRRGALHDANLHRLPLRAIRDVRGDPGNLQFLRNAKAVFGVDLPLRPKSAIETANHLILCVAPGHWLVIGEPHTVLPASVTDVSHGLVGFHLSGTAVTDILAKGSTLDLHPTCFPVGSCARTLIVRISVLLYRQSHTAFQIYCPRSYASHLWTWLEESR